jgi:preprotein translocase subunit SecE
MNAKIAKPDAAASGADIAKYALAVILLVAGLVGYWVVPWAAPLRALLVAAGMVAAGAVFALSAAGKVALEFLGEARFELRKVVWPTRQASLRMTGVIILVIVLMSLVLAIIDFGYEWLMVKVLG